LEPETLSRESKVTESAKEIDDSILYVSLLWTYVPYMSTIINF